MFTFAPKLTTNWIKKILLSILSTLTFLAIAQENRTFDGSNNNIAHPDWGKAGGYFRNYVSNGYADLTSVPSEQNKENPRTISNTLGSQEAFMPNEHGLSDFVWSWGQFIDHDINLNDDNTSEPNNIPIPKGEPIFDPNSTGDREMRMFRSKSDPATGTNQNNPRKHINELTSYIDASTIYGSHAEVSDWLRSYVDGKMKTSANNLLPWNTLDSEFNSNIDPSTPFILLDIHPEPTKYFVSGEVRVNEQPTLTALHTLWVREHNRLCDELKNENPTWSDEELFQRARKIVGALTQVVTYEEFLPAIGVNLDPYTGYDDSVEPNILNVFSAAAYRFGHTMINGRLIRYEEDGKNWSFGAVDLRDAFFNPLIIKNEGGIEPFFRGLAAQHHQLVDPLIMDDIRNFLFGSPSGSGARGIDLLSINIERARERGLPDYNTIRKNLSLAPHADFNSLTDNKNLRTSLATVYKNNINNVDPWIGFMSEEHIPNSVVGEGLNAILKLQFSLLRDGDRFYYENDPAFTDDEINRLKKTSLSEIILRNTSIEVLQKNVFKTVPRKDLIVELFPFAGIRSMKLTAYPNPFQKYFTLIVEANKSTTATLNIWNVNGVKVREENVELVQGSNEYSFELSDELAGGLYIISLDSNNGKGQLRVIKRQ